MEPDNSVAPRGLKLRQVTLMRVASRASVGVAIALIGLKLWAWRATDSVALLSSLADSFLDLIASLITLLAVKVAVSPADREHRFGHGKSEGIASLAQALIVTGSAAYVGVEAVLRLLAPVPISRPGIGIGVMLVSLALTLALVSLQRVVVRRTGSLAIAADAVHYRADILTNLAVLAAILASSRWGLFILDPIFGLAVVALILLSVRSILSDALDVLLDRELPDGKRKKIRELAFGHPEVKGLHDLRTRSSGNAQFIQFHLELDPELTLSRAHEISDAVAGEVKMHFPAAEVLIHVDPHGLVEDRDPF
jgi:ferrous-iron efflux pump FieF